VKSFPLCSALAALLLLRPASRACGPDFPNSYLANSLEEIATLPSLNFASELGRLLPANGGPATPTAVAGEPYDPRAAEIGEVREALLAAGLSMEEAEVSLRNYDRHSPCAGLPREFHLYARGANAWISGNPGEAVTAWRELLALPERDRRYRTVWAAYMLGRALYVSDPRAARDAFHLAREAAARGFPDSQRLSTAGLGWEARSYLVKAAYDEALRLYLRQFQVGDAAALSSLQRTVRYAFVGEEGSGEGNRPSKEEDADDRRTGTYFVAPPCGSLWYLARDRQLRGVVTAWFVSRGGPYGTWGQDESKQLRRWIDALQQAKDLTADEAELWAFACYQCGYWEDAGRFASAASPDGPSGEWVRAMLLLRGGFVDDAAKHLANAAKAFPKDSPPEDRLDEYEFLDSPWARLQGVEGVLALRRDRYSDALRIFLRAGHWADAAFVAERILTLDELVAFVRAEVPAATEPQKQASNWDSDGTRAATSDNDLRFLLARRLVRANRFNEARDYFPKAVRAYYDPYIDDIRKGLDPSRPPEERAGCLWAAAQVIHGHGMEILGTELEPDYAIWDGDFQWPGLWDARYADVTYDPYSSAHFARRAGASSPGILAPTDGELQRAFSHLPPARRFHYGSRATELAWLAAGLLPNDDERTASILDRAGHWIAGRSPEEADLFYKSLVIRCPNTTLGREARAAHWFPRNAAPSQESN
jgi:hypothetical protein